MSETNKVEKSTLIKEVREMALTLNNIRKGDNKHLPMEMSFDEMIKEKYSISQDEYLDKMEINPRIHTMENIFTMPDSDVRWVVPEIMRGLLH